MRPTPARRRRSTFTVAAVTLTLAVGATAASAAPMLTLSDATGNPNSVTIAAGQSFVVTLGLVADRPFQGFSIYLADPAYAGAARFTIASRARLATDPFTDPNGGTIANDPVDAMTRDLGYSNDAGAAAAGAGTYALMTLTVSSSATLAPGTYAVGYNANSVLTDASLSDVAYVGSTPYSVTVTAAPEPATLAAAAATLGALATRRRRRR